MNIDPNIQQQIQKLRIRVENIFSMELVTATEALTESFTQCLNDDYEQILPVLGLNDEDADEYDLDDTYEAVAFVATCNKKGVLVKYSSPIPSDFKFKDDGSISSFSYSWGFFTVRYAYGETLNEALAGMVEEIKSYTEVLANLERK